MGLPLVAFLVVLMAMGWALGLAICGGILRHGMGAESLAWTVIFALAPLSCVYYPITILPDWLQPIAWALPPTYVFEGMRALLIDHVYRNDLMAWSLAINAVLFAASFAIFLALLRSAKRVGSLLGGGE